MSFSRHKEKFPPEISAYFYSSWNKRELWGLKFPRVVVPIRELAWHLDYPFWSSNRPLPLFDLKPRTVLDNPHEYPEQWHRIRAADLKYPIEMGTFGSRRVILDGFHRLLKSIVSGAVSVECKLVPREHIKTAPEHRP